MKNVLRRLALCGLCVTMAAGCGKTADTGKDNAASKSVEAKAGTGVGNSSDSDMIFEIKSKYAGQEKYEYTDPMYNLEKDHIFTYEVAEEFYDAEEYDAFKVYSDGDFEQAVNITVEEDTDANTVTITPNQVFSYEEEEGSSVSDGTWGTRSKFWLVQYIDTKTGKELEKPLVTVFSIAQEMNTPTMKQSVGADGYYKLSWSEVEGADYYEVYEYDAGLEHAESIVTTENLECSNEEFSTVKGYEERFKEKYKDTEIDVDTQWTMNHFLDCEYRYFVVAKTNDGKHSGMSNECAPEEIRNQIPISQSWDFQTEYEGKDALALPAYVEIEMLDGSIGNYVIEYHGANVALMEDNSIVVQAGIKNLPIAMHQMKLVGVDYDTFMEQAEKLTQRGDDLAAKTGIAGMEVDIPFLPDSQESSDDIEEPEDEETDIEEPEDEEIDIEEPEDEETDIEEPEDEEIDIDESEDGEIDIEEPEDEETDIEEPEDEEIDIEEPEDEETDVEEPEDEETDVEEPENGDDKTDISNTAGIELPENVAETVYANSSLSEWIALNLLAHNERIPMDGFNEASDIDRLYDALLEAYNQNPLCGTLAGLKYDYSTSELLVAYMETEEEQKTMQQECLKKAAEIAQDIIKDGMSDYEKEMAINQYLCENAEYNMKIMEAINEDGTIQEEAVRENARSFTPYGILIENLGVCESYSEAFLLIAKEAGLEAVITTGTMQGVNHEWNRVLLDGKWYTLDVTNNDGAVVPNPYCNLSDELASEYMQQDEDAFLDECVGKYTADDTKYEYYNVNGLYAEEPAKAAEILAAELKENGKAYVRMDSNFGNASVEEIASEALAQAQVEYAQYGEALNVIIMTVQ